jgi:hypothetical protein
VQTCQAEGRKRKTEKELSRKEISKKETNGGKTIEEWESERKMEGKKTWKDRRRESSDINRLATKD